MTFSLSLFLSGLSRHFSLSTISLTRNRCTRKRGDNVEKKGWQSTELRDISCKFHPILRSPRAVPEASAQINTRRKRNTYGNITPGICSVANWKWTGHLIQIFCVGIRISPIIEPQQDEPTLNILSSFFHSPFYCFYTLELELWSIKCYRWYCNLWKRMFEERGERIKSRARLCSRAAVINEELIRCILST